jgi:hypothetical protein
MSDNERDKWVMIGVIHYDGEAEIVASLFESQEIPLVIQGRNHRRMMGILGGRIVEMRLLVPEARRADGESLLNDYTEQRDRELESDELTGMEDEGRPRLLFNRTVQRMGVALLAAAFLGFGLASLSAGVWGAALILAPLQALAYWGPATTWTAELLGVDSDALITNALVILPLLDLSIAWIVLLLRALVTRSDQQS